MHPILHSLSFTATKLSAPNNIVANGSDWARLTSGLLIGEICGTQLTDRDIGISIALR